MQAGYLLAVAGMLVAAGVVMAVAALRVAPPSLKGALAQLSAPTSAAPRVGADRWGWLPEPVVEALQQQLRVSDADLQILGWTRQGLAARKVTLALTGLFLPPVLMLVLSFSGVSLPFAIPVVVGLVLAVWLWRLPDQDARETAEKARGEFRSALSGFLDLVALERVARGSVPEALESAAELSGSAPFLQIRSALQRAALSGHTPWHALRELGEQLDVVELRNLGDIAEVAADGASVYRTLLAESRSLRHAELSAARAQANAASERMSIPVALLTIGLMLFVFVPFMIRLFGSV